jgi:hypothetical protein
VSALTHSCQGINGTAELHRNGSSIFRVAVFVLRRSAEDGAMGSTSREQVRKWMKPGRCHTEKCTQAARAAGICDGALRSCSCHFFYLKQAAIQAKILRRAMKRCEHVRGQCDSIPGRILSALPFNLTGQVDALGVFCFG